MNSPFMPHDVADRWHSIVKIGEKISEMIMAFT